MLERESLVTMNVHACKHVHVFRRMCGVHGKGASILQKKCRSLRLKVLEHEETVFRSHFLVSQSPNTDLLFGVFSSNFLTFPPPSFQQ